VLIVLACSLIALLAGCGENNGSVTTNCPVPTAPPLSTPSPAATLPPGWSWYNDQHYGFRLPIPPGWRAGAFHYDEPGYVEDHVLLLPPCVNGPFDQTIATKQDNVIWLAVSLDPSDVDQTIKDEANPEPAMVSVGGTTTALYDLYLPVAGDRLEREVAVRFGQHPYLFYLKSTQGSDSLYLPLYLTVMQYFAYTGTSA
jgi:hypothetical protein